MVSRVHVWGPSVPPAAIWRQETLRRVYAVPETVEVGAGFGKGALPPTRPISRVVRLLRKFRLIGPHPVVSGYRLLLRRPLPESTASGPDMDTGAWVAAVLDGTLPSESQTPWQYRQDLSDIRVSGSWSDLTGTVPWTMLVVASVFILGIVFVLSDPSAVVTVAEGIRGAGGLESSTSTSATLASPTPTPLPFFETPVPFEGGLQVR